MFIDLLIRYVDCPILKTRQQLHIQTDGVIALLIHFRDLFLTVCETKPANSLKLLGIQFRKGGFLVTHKAMCDSAAWVILVSPIQAGMWEA